MVALLEEGGLINITCPVIIGIENRITILVSIPIGMKAIMIREISGRKRFGSY